MKALQTTSGLATFFPTVYLRAAVIFFGCVLGCIVSSGAAETPAAITDKNSNAVLLGPEDQLSIRVADFDEIPDKPIRIDFSGYIDIPVIGRVMAGGKTVPQLESELGETLRKYIKRPQVTVGVVEMRSRPVSVLGAVNKPGIYQLEGPRTLLEMLSLAGGLRPDAGSRVRVTRPSEAGPLGIAIARTDLSGRFQMAEIDLDDLMKGQDPTLNVIVRPHDLIAVHKGELIYIIGDVKKPGGFALSSHERISLLKGLALAEGPERSASLKNSRILRSEVDGEARKEIPVNIGDILTGKAPDIGLQADDVLFIPNNTARSIMMRSAEVALQLGTGILIYRH
jgi:polysaccharide export outer membrane protein